MEQKKYDIFISYRRDGGEEYARMLQLALEKYYNVFLDYDELKDGVFNERIMNAIKESPVFLLVLSKGALDRCVDEEDMVRKEILFAQEYHCHIVPVNINEEFGELPEELPDELKNIVGPHQYSDFQTKKLFKKSIELLIEDRIKHYVKRDDTKDGKEIHIETDVDCDLYCFKEFKKQLKAEQDNVVWLKPGVYKLKFVSVEFPSVKDEKRYDLPSDKEVDYFEISLGDKVEQAKAKRKTEAKVLNDKGCKYYQKENFDDAVNCWRKAAEYGNADAQFNLGKMYQNGQGVKQSDTEAVKWFSVATENGHVEAQGKLGICYFNGNGVEKDYSLAAKWLAKAAEQGNPEAQFYIGYMYDLGLGVNTDYSIAADWYQKSTDQGNMNAWLYLAYLNISNCGVKRNISKLREEFCELENEIQLKDLKNDFLINAAKTGDVKAQLILGVITIDDNFKDGVKWIEKAVENDCDLAKLTLAFVWMDDDSEKAVSLAKPLAEKNNPIGQFLMSLYYYQRTDYREAISWAKKAVIQEGMNLLYGEIGDCYNELQDYNEALKWYRIAQERGEDVEWKLERVEKKIEEAKRQAELELKRKQEEEERIKAEEDALRYNKEILAKAGDVFQTGRQLYEKGMYEEAVKWYRKAAEQGNAAAQYSLGYMYQYGKGVPQNDEEAVKWYRKAAQRGDADAKKRMETILMMAPVTKLTVNNEVTVKKTGKSILSPRTPGITNKKEPTIKQNPVGPQELNVSPNSKVRYVHKTTQTKEPSSTSLNPISYAWFSGFLLSAIILIVFPFATGGLLSKAGYLWYYLGCLIAIIPIVLGSYVEYDSCYNKKDWCSRYQWQVDWDDEGDVIQWFFGIGIACIIIIGIIGAFFYGGSITDNSPIYSSTIPVIAMAIIYAFWHGVFVVLRLAREHLSDGLAHFVWIIGILPLMVALGSILYTSLSHDSKPYSESTIIKNNVEEIDLDLPSGTIWASCNLGATSAEEDGLQFCFGNLESKEDIQYYDEDNDPGKRFKEGESIIGTEYDVATVKWGKDWQMPSKEQFEELIYSCKFVIKEKGYEVIGPTGKKLFLPYSKGEHNIGYYWSGIKSNVMEIQPGYKTLNQEDKPEIRERFATYCQLSIRPVKSYGKNK